MPITTFSGEKNLGEISDKLFVRLTARQREKVEDELLKVNPQLRELSSVPPGAVLNVPDIPELRAKARTTPDGPDAQLFAQLRADLSGYSKQLATRNDEVKAAIAETRKVLADQVLTKVIGDDKVLRTLADGIGKANAEREQDLEEQQKALGEAFEQMLKDLDSR